MGASEAAIWGGNLGREAVIARPGVATRHKQRRDPPPNAIETWHATGL